MGGFWTLLLNGLVGMGAIWAAGHGLRQPPGIARILAAVVLGWSWITLGMEGLGGLGFLGRGPLLAWAAAGAAIGLGLRLARPLPGSGASPADPGSRADGKGWGVAAVVGLGLVLWAGTFLGVRSLLYPVKVVSDGPIYHLLFAIRWWKEGRLFLIPTPFGENAAPYFPAVGDLWLAWLTIGWGSDRLARVGQVPFLPVAGLAAAGLARQLGARVPAATLAACWFVATAPLFLFSFEPNVDTIFVAAYLMAAYFFLRFAQGEDDLGTLGLGGLAAGGALGIKAPAFLFVGPLVGLGALAVVGRGTTLRRRFIGLAALGMATALLPAYYFVRNARLTGNPLYPLHLEAFGRTWLAGWYGPEVMRLSKYYIPAENWRAGLDILLAVLDPRLAPVWFLAMAGAWAIGRPGTSHVRRWAGLLAGLALLNVLIFWGLVPYRTQQRFMLQAVGLAAAPLALLLDRSALLRVAAAGLLAVHILTPLDWPFAAAPWDFAPEIPVSPHPILSVLPAARPQGETATIDRIRSAWPVLVLGLGAFLVAGGWTRAIARPSARRLALALGLSMAQLALAVALIYPWSLSDRETFYPPFRDYYQGWSRLELLSGESGERVAYAGTNLPYYLMASGLRNEVRYVNVDAHRDWLLHDYHREAIRRGDRPTWNHPRPGWDRIAPDYDAWLANLRAEGISLLVVARANPDEGPYNLADPEGFPIERQWAEGHPETFVPLYGVAESDPELRIYRVRPGRE